MTELDTTKPAGNEAPTTLDDYIRQMKTAIIERLDVDHFFNLTGSLLDEVAAGGGLHRRVLFKAAIVDPAPAAGQYVLYTKTVAGKPELHIIGDGTVARQLTNLSKLNILGTDLAAVIDNSTIVLSGGKLAVPVDNVTTEISAAKLAIKVPAATTPGAIGGSALVESPVFAVGWYDGNGANPRDIAVGAGLTVRVLWIQNCTIDGRAARVSLNVDGVARSQDIATPDQEDGKITYIANGYRINAADAPYNAVGSRYVWWALCSR